MIPRDPLHGIVEEPTRTRSDAPDDSETSAPDSHGQSAAPTRRADSGAVDRSGETIGHFRLVEKLGEGGMGVVYAAEDARLGRTVALKILQAAAVANPDRRRRFFREARAASAVMHPNIATVFEVGEDGGEVFLAMERVEGKTLRAILREGDAALDVGRALGIAREVARGLEHAHRAGVVHRDLKPENVMQTADGTVKLLDFGLAKRVAGGAVQDAAPRASDVATVAGKILGTPGYMAPEQARGAAIDARTDVFSLGAMLFELVTAERPFRGPDAMAVLIATDRDPAPPASSRNPKVPAAVDRLIARCLEKRPDDRFASCADFLAELATVLEGTETAEARPAPRSGAATEERTVTADAPRDRAVRRGWGRAAGLAAAGVAAAIALVALWRVRSPGPAGAPGETAALRHQCVAGDRGSTECGDPSVVAWCDPGGGLVGCCGTGLVPKAADGICGCAPGGTNVPEARARGCAAVPADAEVQLGDAKKKALDAAIQCFEPLARASKIEGGLFEAVYFLTLDGEVFGARVQRCTLPEEQAQSCALAALRATRFPPPPAEEVGTRKTFGFLF